MIRDALRIVGGLLRRRDPPDTPVHPNVAAARLGSEPGCPRPINWRAGETVSGLLLGGWTQLDASAAAAALAKPRSVEPSPRDARALGHLRQAPGTPVVLRSPAGELVHCEPEGEWPVSIVPPQPGEALAIFAGQIHPRHPIPREVLTLLAHSVPFETVRLVVKVNARFLQSDDLEVSLPGLHRLGPFLPHFLEEVGGQPGGAARGSLAQASMALRQVRIASGLEPGVAAALIRHEVAHILLALARETGRLDKAGWLEGLRNMPHPSRRSHGGLDEAIAETVAGVMAAHPTYADATDDRQFGRARLARTRAYERAVNLLGDQVREMLSDPEVGPVRTVEEAIRARDRQIRFGLTYARSSESRLGYLIGLTKMAGSRACVERSSDELAQARKWLAQAQSTYRALGGPERLERAPPEERASDVGPVLEALRVDLVRARAFIELRA